jgi:hypothetical protein
MKLIYILDKIEKKFNKESGSSKLGNHRSLMRKEEQGVVADITITPKGIPIRENTTTQVHLLSGSIIRGLVWMHCEEK